MTSELELIHAHLKRAREEIKELNAFLVKVRQELKRRDDLIDKLQAKNKKLEDLTGFLLDIIRLEDFKACRLTPEYLDDDEIVSQFWEPNGLAHEPDKGKTTYLSEEDLKKGE